MDLVRFFKICYACITESIANLDKLSLDQAKKLRDICESFAKLSEETQIQVSAMLSQLKEQMGSPITFFRVNYSA